MAISEFGFRVHRDTVIGIVRESTQIFLGFRRADIGKQADSEIALEAITAIGPPDCVSHPGIWRCAEEPLNFRDRRLVAVVRGSRTQRFHLLLIKRPESWQGA
jgi:hypothetical protein